MDEDPDGLDDVGAAAMVDDEGQGSADHQVLEFEVGGDRFAVDVEELVLIDEDVAVTRLPRSPEAVVGITDMRGDVTGVLEPSTLLGVDGDGDRRYLLVTEGRGERQKVGLLVDDVERVRGYDESDVDRSEDLDELDSEGLSNDVVRGVIRREESDEVRLIGWISLDDVMEEVEDGVDA